MPVGKRDVGERLYVFSSQNGLQATQECIIDAHGEQFLFGNSRGIEFTVPAGTTLHFYVPHDVPLAYGRGTGKFGRNFGDDPRDYHFTSTVEQIMTGNMPAAQVVPPGRNSADYVLTKIQRTTEGCTGGWWSNFWSERNPMTYGDLVNFMRDHNQAVKDIVTIRNRRFRSDMTLSSTIALLRAQNYNYTRIHCSFCRNTVFGALLPRCCRG